MNYIYLILITAIFLSCSSDQKEVTETVTMEELMGEVDVLDATVSEESIDSENVLLSDGSALSNLIHAAIPGYDTLNLSQPHKMDRYGYSSSKKVRFENNSELSNSIVDVYQYNFSDSLKLNNAFYNWLDCYGENCTEININEDIKNSSTSHSFTLIYDTVLVSVKYNDEINRSDVKSFEDSLMMQFGKEYRYKIQTDKKGSLKWK